MQTLKRGRLPYPQLAAAVLALALALGADGFLVGVPLYNPSKLQDDDKGKALGSQLHRCRMLAAVLAVLTTELGMSVLIMGESRQHQLTAAVTSVMQLHGCCACTAARGDHNRLSSALDSWLALPCNQPGPGV